MNKQLFAAYPNHFVAGDIHFNHKNIPLYCKESRGQFLKCVGQDTDGKPVYEHLIHEMNEEIIVRWNSVVSPDDHTFILGDVAMGVIDAAPALIRRLNGDKTLICGNHDRALIKHHELRSLFIDVRDYLCFSSYGVGIVMSHFPFASWDGQGHGACMLHGHLHSPSDALHYFPNRRIMDVGIDGNDLYPRSLEDTVEFLKKIPKPEYDHHSR